MAFEQSFTGSKIAVLCGQELITYKRDYTPGIPFQGMWDFPGGGREGDETPVECALRELNEEFSLRIASERVDWIRSYPGHSNGVLVNYFMIAKISMTEVSTIIFGDEGERWRMMEIDEYLSRKDAVPHLKNRLSDYLNET